MSEPVNVLELARRDIGCSVEELWCRYFALGGMHTAIGIDVMLKGALIGAAVERDRLAVGLNESRAELGGDHPVPYAGDEPTST